MESKGIIYGQDGVQLPQLPQTPSATRNDPAAHIHHDSFPKDDLVSVPQTPQLQICSTPPPLKPPGPLKVRIKRRRPGAVDIPHRESSLLSILDRSSPPLRQSDDEKEQQRFLAPPSEPAAPLATRPHTPLARLQTSFNNSSRPVQTPEPWSAQSAITKGESITRPSSTWSDISDSSASSLSSFGTFATQAENCTSPGGELVSDPFTHSESQSVLMPSAIPKNPHQVERRFRKDISAQWSPEMDEHLWLTYMKYLSDPMVTPFKTLPGTAPPLGVCHRVARRAKRNWKASRALLGTVTENETSSFASLDDIIMHRQSSAPVDSSPATIKPLAIPRSSSAGARWNPNRWPHSGSATRKRLRELCKHKPTLSPHYQRLMHSRSPSPFESSSSHGQSLSSPRAASSHSSFSTRDLNMTLSTSTASTMQPGNPLSQLASSDPTTPQRTNMHVKSQSLQSTFGVANDRQHQEGLASLRRLASPFQEQPRRDPKPSSEGQSSLQPPQMNDFQSHKSASPLEIKHPKPMSASMKRRAQYQLGEEPPADDLELRRGFLEDIFRDPAVASGKRRVRSRCFSLGAVRNASSNPAQNPTQLNELFTPPVTEDNTQVSSASHQRSCLPAINLGDVFQPSAPSQHARTPTLAAVAGRRLGSPFVPTASVAQSNTFPRSLFPHGLDSISNLDSQRQHEPPKPDVDMDDPFGSDNL